MKLTTKWLMRGKFREIKGTFRQVAGKVCASRSMGMRGRFEKVTGRLQCRVARRTASVFGL